MLYGKVRYISSGLRMDIIVFCGVFLLFIVNWSLLKSKPLKLLKYCPDNSGWYILGENYKYGPFSAQKIITYYYSGEMSAHYNCYSSIEKKYLTLGELVSRYSTAKLN